MTELIYHMELKRVGDLYKMASYIELIKSAIEYENQLNQAKITLLNGLSNIVFQLSSKFSNQNEKKINLHTPELSSTLSEEPQRSENTKGQVKSVENGSNLSNYSCQNIEKPQQKIGIYTPEERFQKILKYKLKLNKYRIKIPVVRKYEGRSKIASCKIRNRGRFVKQVPLRKALFKIC